MTKRLANGASKTMGFTRVYKFSVNTIPDVVPFTELIGCQTIAKTLESEIAIPLKHPELFESSRRGSLPVNRCFRFFGVENSSKRTAVLSFAMQHRIDTVLIHTSTGFDPEVHLNQIYEKVQSFTTPSIVLFHGVDNLLRVEKNAMALANCLRRVQMNQYLVWTGVISHNNLPLPICIDRHFADCTKWAGFYAPQQMELFTHLDRQTMLEQCIQKYTPNVSCQVWPNTQERREFIEKWTNFCTYNEIDKFVRRVFNLKRTEHNHALMLGQTVTPSELLPTKSHFMNCLHRLGNGEYSICHYPPFYPNVNEFHKERA